MATQIENTAPSGTSNKVTAYVNQQLEVARRQVKSTDLIGGFLTILVISLGMLLVAALWDAWISPLSETGRWLCLLVLVGSSLAYGLTQIAPLFLKRINPDYAARMIEQSKPGFKNSLLNYVALRRRSEDVNPAVFSALARQAAEDLKTVPSDATVDRSKLIRLGFILVGLTVFTVGYKMISPKDPLQSFARILIPSAKIGQPARVSISDIKPGDLEVFFGDQVDVSAVVRGKHQPSDVALVISTPDGQLVNQRIPMQPEDLPNRYRVTLGKDSAGLQQSLIYRIEALDGVSPEFEITVKPNPTIAIETLTLFPPKYTKLPKQTQVGQGEINALEGTKIIAEAIANAPIREAHLDLLQINESDSNDNLKASYQTIKSIPMEVDGTKAKASFWAVLNRARERSLASHYQLRFTTVEGDRNQKPNIYPIKVTPDLAPEIRILAPRESEISLPADGALAIDFEANDLDFEISEVQFHLNHQGRLLAQEKISCQPINGQQRVKGRRVLEPAQFGLRAGDTAVFFLTAADNRTVPADENQTDPNITRSDNFTLTITDPSGKSQKANSTNATPGGSDQQPKNPSPPANQTQDGAKDPNSADAQSNDPQPDNSAEQNQEKSNSESSKDSQGNDSQGNDSQNGNSQGSDSQNSNSQNQEPQQGDSQAGDSQAGDSQSGDSQSSDSQSGDSQGQDSSSSKADSSQDSGSQSSSDSGNGSSEQSDANQNPSGNQSGNQASGGNQNASNSDSMNSGSQSPSNGAQNNSSNGASNANSGSSSNQPNPNSSSASGAPDGNAGNESSGSDSTSDSAGPESRDNQLNSGERKPLSKDATQGEQMRRLEELLNEPNQTPSEDQNSESGSGTESGQSKPATENSNATGDPSKGNSDSQSNPSTEPNSSNQGANASGSSKTDAAQPDDRQGTGNESGNRPDQTDQNKNGQSNPSESDPNSGNQNSESSSSDQQPENQDSQGNSQSGMPSDQNPAEQDAQGQSRNNPSSSADQQSDARNSDQNRSEADPKNSDRAPTGPESPSESDNTAENSDSGSPKDSNSQSKASNEEASKNSNSSNQGEPDESESSNPPQSDSQPDDRQSSSPQSNNQQAKGPQSKGQQTDSQSSNSPQSEQPSSENSQPSANEQPASDQQQSTGQPQGQSQQKGNSSSGSQSSDVSEGQPGGQPSPDEGGRTMSNQRANASQGGKGMGDLFDLERDKLNLEHSKKATDLILKKLNDQKYKPDPKLLEQMNWTQEDLNQFLSRWQEMKQAADKGDSLAGKRYEQMLRSLDFRAPSQSRTVRQSREEIKGLNQDSAVIQPPPEFAPDFNATLRDLNRND